MAPEDKESETENSTKQSRNTPKDNDTISAFFGHPNFEFAEEINSTDEEDKSGAKSFRMEDWLTELEEAGYNYATPPGMLKSDKRYRKVSCTAPSRVRRKSFL